MANRWPPDNRYPRDRSPPPRGPRNSYDNGRGPGSFVPRGRGFGGRGDFARQDREPPRDQRDPSPPSWSQDRNRTWRDRDYDRTPVRRPSPSRSRLPQSDPRDNNDRYVPDRNLGLGRGRRNSREDTFQSPQAAPFRDNGPSTFRGRGTFPRGRGRGDFEFRGRVRPSFGDDRETARARSRSPRDDRWERDSNRDGREFDRRDDRRPNWREEDRPADRNDRDREPDRFRRDPLPTNDSRRVSAPTSRSETPQSGQTGPAYPPPSIRQVQEQGRDDSIQRRASTHTAPTFARDPRVDNIKPDLLASRVEASSRKYGSGASSPMVVPQVPAFGWPGSKVWRAPVEGKPPAPPVAQPKAVSEVKPLSERKVLVETRMQPDPKPQPSQVPAVVPPRATSPAAPSRQAPNAPTAPKADLERQPPPLRMPDSARMPPTAPRAERTAENASRAPRPPPPPPPPPSFVLGRPVESPVSLQISQGNSNQQPLQEISKTSPGVISQLLRSPPTQPKQFGSIPATTQPPLRNDVYQPTAVPPTAPSGSAATSPTTTTPFSPPLGPRLGSSFSAPTGLGVNVPTGPRAERATPQVSNRLPVGLAQIPSMHGPSTRQWNRPSPIMGQTFKTGSMVPAKRDAQGEEKERFSTRRSFDYGVKVEEATTLDGAKLPTRSPANSSVRSPLLTFSSKQSPAVGVGHIPNPPSPFQKEDSLPPPALSQKDTFRPPAVSATVISAALEDLVDDEDAMLLDDVDLEKQDADFQKRKAELEAQKIDLSSRRLRGASPLETLAYLGRMMLDDIPLEALRAEPAAKQQLLTPKAEESDNVEIADVLTATAHSTPSIGSPELASLPFLAQAPLTPLSELDVIQEHFSHHELFRSTVAAAMVKMADEENKHEGTLREEYATFYRPWKKHCDEIYEEKDLEKGRDERDQIAAITQPVPPVIEAPSTPAAIVEGRRGRGGNNTEYDLQKVLQESMLTATIENANREKEALGSKPDFDREAVIPDLLTEEEQISSIFRDTSRLKTPDHALKFFQLAPSKDDFTADEHRTLVLAYQTNPKQFGFIARTLPGRNYKECLNHYYATKWSGEYKPPPGKRKNKGRVNKRGYPVSGRPKANALLSNRTDIYDQEDYANAAVAVTDTGRPRRAAAPYAREKESDESGNQAPPLARRGAKADAAEPGSEKPVRKPKGPPREKSARKVKTIPAPVSRQLSMSPEKTEPEPKPQVLETTPAPALLSVEMDAVNGLAAMQSGQPFPVMVEMHQNIQNDFESPNQQAITLQGLETPEVAKGGLPPKMLGTASSYWSKQEMRDFPRYLNHFGTDWQAIAQEMGTKTHTMVCTPHPARPWPTMPGFWSHGCLCMM